jgi:hypothetical protein
VTLELPDAARKAIAGMVDEVQDRLDDMVPEYFPHLRGLDIEGDPKVESLIDQAFGLVYEEFMRVMRNAPEP